MRLRLRRFAASAVAAVLLMLTLLGPAGAVETPSTGGSEGVPGNYQFDDGTPLFWSNFNPYGRFELDLDRHLDLAPAA